MTREEEKQLKEAKAQMKQGASTAWKWCTNYWKDNVAKNWKKGSYISSILYAFFGVVIIVFVLSYMLLSSGNKK